MSKKRIIASRTKLLKEQLEESAKNRSAHVCRAIIALVEEYISIRDELVSLGLNVNEVRELYQQHMETHVAEYYPTEAIIDKF